MNILLICAPSARKLRKRIKVKEFLKKAISIILSVIIIFGCCFYTYADRELPGKEKQITVTSEYNDNVTIKKLAEQYRGAWQEGTDFSSIAQRMNLKFEGKIRADQISISEDGRLIVSTEDFYWDYGEIPGFFAITNTESDPSPYGAKIVIYLNSTNQKKFSTGQTIKFKADFWSMDGRTMVLTNGVLE